MASNPKSSQPPDIEALKKRHRELENAKIAAQTNLKTAMDQLEQLKKESRDQYGTDDLKQLVDKLEEMKRDNERKRLDYDHHLAEIEKNLSQVEQDRSSQSGN